MTLNPLFWLHFRTSGHARTNILVVVGFTGVVLLFASLSFYIAAASVPLRDRPATFAGVNAVWLMIMTAAQALFLLLLGPSALRRAVQRDFDSGMIESHRLSPMSNLKIILGYLTGAPVQAGLLYAVSLLFGSYFAARYALSPGLGGVIGLRATLLGWYSAQGCMLLLSFMIGALILLSSIATHGKANIVGILVLIGFIGGWVAIVFIPGISLLLGVMSGGVLVGLITPAKVSGDPSVILVAASLQLVFGIIVLAAACGKLRAPERPLFSIHLGLILLAAWGVTLVTGLHIAPKYDWLFSEWREYTYVQLVASTIAFMLIGFFPLITAAVNLYYRDRAAGYDERTGKLKWVALHLMPVLLAGATVLCLLLMLGAIDRTQLPRVAHGAFQHWPAWTAIGAALLLSFWTDFHWVYFLKAYVRRPMIGLLIAIAVLKGGPLLLDGTVQFAVEEMGEGRWNGYGYLTGLSPLGTLIFVPQGGPAIWTGLGVQAVVAFGATLLARRARRRLSQHRVAQDR